MAQVLQILSEMSVRDNSRNEWFERVKQETDRLLEELNACKKKNEKLEKTLLEREVVRKVMKWSFVDLERSGICLAIDFNLVKNTNEELLSFSSQTVTSSGWITKKLLKSIPCCNYNCIR